jgi:hypothetical protein
MTGIRAARVGDPCPSNVAAGVGSNGSEAGRRVCRAYFIPSLMCGATAVLDRSDFPSDHPVCRRPARGAGLAPRVKVKHTTSERP